MGTRMHKDTIFREYDVRGIVGKDYDTAFAGDLAASFAAFVTRQLKTPGHGRTRFKIAVGRDVRPSGTEMAPLFCKALLDRGFDVVDLGVVPTPLVYFSTFYYEVDGAVCITGSHNPPEYNGFKICLGQSTLHGSQVQELKHILAAGETLKPTASRGQTETKPVVADYHRHVLSIIKIPRKVKVVIDSGNAVGGLVAPKLLRELGCEVIELFCYIDGSFPNHHPDPTVEENLVDLKAAVAEHRADLGIAFDGDADRIGAVDEKGHTIFGDELMILYAREILTRKPGAKIIGEVKCSNRMFQDIEKRGGKPIMWKTGHSLIKSKMKEENAELAGEMSGHIFFKDRYFGYDDAIYAAARLLEIAAGTNEPFSTLLADLPPTVNTPELRVDCPDDVKFKVVERVKTELARRFKVIDIDGVRIETDRGWGLLRASNTQPVVVMRFEAQTVGELNELRYVVESAFKAALKSS